MAVENQSKNDRFDINKKFLKDFHNNVLAKVQSGKEGEKTVTMKIASIGLAPDKHYLLPRFDPKTGEVIQEEKTLIEKYMPLIESGQIKSYSSPEEAEKDRKIMYPQIIGKK